MYLSIMLNIKTHGNMDNSQTTFSKQAVEECISLGFYAYNESQSVEDWAIEYADLLWDNRTELDEERDTKGGVTTEDYRTWAIDKANYLIQD